ncbi:MAG TPA: AAA family ATPase, partial [Myxococcota bacterium]|nr:AAA family ATPase [Myxococcota bacterium]
MPRTPGSLFVGRKAELGLLRGELAAALAGEGRLALLVGEAGIGKTRTASALAGEAHEAGALVAWGHCCEGDGVPVYRPWLQALDACAAELPSSVPATLVARLRETGGPSDGATGAPEHARFELFERFLAALAAIGRERPIVLVLDDLQWGDVGSLRLLEFVARELRPHRLLLLGTVRAAEPCPSRARAELLASVARSARSVPLGALDRPAVRKLLGERLGRHPEEALLDRVYRASGGNPFFVIELAHLVAAAGADSPLPVPPAARQVLRERLAPLSPASLRALEAAAVLGPEFELDPLAAVLRQPVETLLATLAEPFALGLVRELPDARRRCAFGHALVRELLYTSLPPAARSALHGALAEALEAAGPADGERLAALAHHFFEAAQSGDPAKAIRYGCEAGEHALASLAYEEAARRFERALAAAALGGDDAARLRALVGLGEALSGAGDLARRDAVFAEAVGVARRIGSGAFATTALRWAIARTELGVPGIEVNALLEEALSILPGDPSPLRARLMARLAAGLHLLPGTEARRQELAEAAVAMARGLDDPATLAFVRARSLMGLLGPDGLERRLATTDEILRAGPASRVAELETLLLRVDDLVERAD